MSESFLAEHFRNLLDKLNILTETDTNENNDETPEVHDVDGLLKTDIPSGINKESVKEVNDLVDYLDQFPELKKWRNENALYDDACYENIPLDSLENISGLTLEDLKRIEDGTLPYEGAIVIHNGVFSLFGGD